MKAYRNLAIICFALVILFTGLLGYVIGYSNGINEKIHGIGKEFPDPAIPGEYSGYWTPPTILLTEYDGTDRITVVYREDGIVFSKEYMTQKEYANTFRNYINYKP